MNSAPVRKRENKTQQSIHAFHRSHDKYGISHRCQQFCFSKNSLRIVLKLYIYIMKNRLIQFHGSSSFHSLSQNIPFYQSTTTPLKPYLGKGICKISHSIALYNSAIIRTESGKKQNGCTQQTEIVAVVISFLFIFSSNKSLSTPEFFLMVIKNTLTVSPRHSLDLI